MTLPTATPTAPTAPPSRRESRRPEDARDRDQDRLIHIVMDRDKVREAMRYGFPVKALCGKRWVPRRWKPKDGLRCEVCATLAARQRFGYHPPGW